MLLHYVAKRIDFFLHLRLFVFMLRKAKRNKERDNFCKCDINGQKAGQDGLDGGDGGDVE